MRAGARKVVSDSDNRVMSLIIGHRRSPTESEKRDNSVIGTHSLPVGLPRSERSVKTTLGLHGRYWHSTDQYPLSPRVRLLGAAEAFVPGPRTAAIETSRTSSESVAPR